MSIYKYIAAAGIIFIILFSSPAPAKEDPDCRYCHYVNVVERHHFYNQEYSCAYCHPAVNNSILLERNCVNCHNGTAFYANPDLNPGSPLHIPVTINVMYPDTGDVWVRDTAQTIRWNYTGSPGPVKIELLKTGIFDQTINPIIAGINGSGYYDFAVPRSKEIGYDYQVRISSVLGTTGNLYTDTGGNFSIVRKN